MILVLFFESMGSIKCDAPARSKRKNEGFGTTKCGSSGDGLNSLDWDNAIYL